MNKRHWTLMLLCCLVPLAALAAIFLFQVQVSTALLFALILFCPLSHLLMMSLSEGDHRHTIGNRRVETNSMNIKLDKKQE
jgi:cytochrome c oxidase subunit IV